MRTIPLPRRPTPRDDEVNPRRRYTFEELDAGWLAAIRFVETCRWQSHLLNAEADDALLVLKSLFKQAIQITCSPEPLRQVSSRVVRAAGPGR